MDDNALRRQIAERLGWRDFREVEGWYDTPENTWKALDLHGIPPGEADHRLVPKFDTDPAAALALPTHGYQLRLFSPSEHDSEEWEALYTRPGVVGYRAFAERPALAISRAWLAMMEAEDGDAE